MSTYTEKMKKEREAITAAAREKTMGYILGAFGLIAGLAWNDAVKALIEYFFPTSRFNSLYAKFGYAIFITIVVVIVSVYVTRLFTKREKEQEKTGGGA